MIRTTPLGVGFFGAGLVTQAIHLPTLARLGGDLRVVHVNDVDAEVAASVARRVGARSSTSVDALLDDPLVDVVAVCSPHRFHAAQVIAACRAGKKAVLCEKPFAMSADEAGEIAAVSDETGVPVLVGAMHVFDPGWQAAAAHWNVLPSTNHTIRSSIVLPPNPRFEDLATEVAVRPAPQRSDPDSPDLRAATVHAGVMGLAIHDLPLVRALLPSFDDLVVHSAHVLVPSGYQIVLTAAGRRVELHARMSATWRPEWVLEAYSASQALHLTFPPSYVHAGSAVATLSTAGFARTWGPTDHNGYEGEWRTVTAVARGEMSAPPLAGLVDDLEFAITVADAAAHWVRTHHQAGVEA